MKCGRCNELGVDDGKQGCNVFHEKVLWNLKYYFN